MQKKNNCPQKLTQLQLVSFWPGLKKPSNSQKPQIVAQKISPSKQSQKIEKLRPSSQQKKQAKIVKPIKKIQKKKMEKGSQLKLEQLFFRQKNIKLEENFKQQRPQIIEDDQKMPECQIAQKQSLQKEKYQKAQKQSLQMGKKQVRLNYTWNKMKDAKFLNLCKFVQKSSIQKKSNLSIKQTIVKIPLFASLQSYQVIGTLDVQLSELRQKRPEFLKALFESFI